MPNNLIQRHYLVFHFKDGTERDFEIKNLAAGDIVITDLSNHFYNISPFFRFRFGENEEHGYTQYGSIEVNSLLYVCTKTIPTSVKEDE